MFSIFRRSPLFRSILCSILCSLFTLMTLSSVSAQLKIIDQARSAPPYQLTTQDGTGLELVALNAKTVIDGPLAFTELHLKFRNPHARTIEGRFEVTMPDRAALSRFAMKIKGSWMEGEVVEKQAARRAYEDALHRRQDPALLEQDAGNQFRARVFPITAHENKELIISWSQELNSAQERYRLPLIGLPKIKELSLTALIAKSTSSRASSGVQSSLGGEPSRYEVTQVKKRDFKPTQDWTLSGGVTSPISSLRSDNIALVKVTLPERDLKESVQEHLVVLFDSSVSRMVAYEAQLSRLNSFLKRASELGVKQLSVIAFDQDSQQIYHGPLSGFGDAHIKALGAREALGASNLKIGLDAVAQLISSDTHLDAVQTRRLLLMSDGVYTDGPSQPAELQTLLSESLLKSGIQRVDAWVDQSARDLIALEKLTTATGFKPGKVLTEDLSNDERIKRLKREAFAALKVNIPHAKWTWPSELKGLQPGDQALIYADLPESEALSLTLSNADLSSPLSFEVPTQYADPSLLKRAWVRARIERLLNKMSSPDPDMKGVWRQQIIKLSTEHRVLSPYTALVVLESEAMYRRFNIKRNALSDILVVGSSGVEVLARSTPYIPPPQPVAKPRVKRKVSAKKMKRRASTRRGDSASSSARALDSDDEVAVTAPSDRASSVEAAPPPPPPPASSPSPVSGAVDRAESESEMVLMEEEPAAPIAPAPRRSRRAQMRRSSRVRSRPRTRPGRPQKLKGAPALTGEMAKISKLIKKKRHKKALKVARAWRAAEPANLLTLIALGQALQASGDDAKAARAYGSVIDFYPSRADMRRLAGNWLERLGKAGLALAESTYRVAAEQRPDHPSVYHMWAMSLVKLERYSEGLEAILKGIKARRADRFPGVDRILREDAQLIAAAWIQSSPTSAAEAKRALTRAGLSFNESAPESVRFILTWENDANDVDFHIYDREGGHAFYRQRQLESGGELYADITRGYGPECFTINTPRAAPYELQAHYYRRGPMGYGAGKLQVLKRDRQGRLTFEERPFVIMNDGAYVNLGSVKLNTRVKKKAKRRAKNRAKKIAR